MINPIHAPSELEDFMESFDDRVEYLSEKLQKYVKQLVEEETVTEPENFVGEKKTMAGETHKYMAPNGSLKQFTNMTKLFQMAILISPTASNVEHVFFCDELDLFAAENVI